MLPPAVQLFLSQFQQGNLVNHHLLLPNDLERIFQPSCELLYVINTPHRKQETHIYQYNLHEVILPIKMHNSALLFGSMLLKHTLNTRWFKYDQDSYCAVQLVYTQISPGHI
jgi:hypothetical protein